MRELWCSIFHKKHRKPLYYLGYEMLRVCELCQPGFLACVRMVAQQAEAEDKSKGNDSD